MADKISQAEQQYYGEVVESTVKQVAKLPKDKAEAADKLVESVLQKETIHEELKLRFRREVMKRVADLRAKAKTEQEEKILNKFEDQVDVVGGKFRPVGVDEKFSVRVKAGNVFHRVFGKNVDANDLDAIMRETQEIEDRIEANKAQLAVLTAAKESTSNVLGLAKDIFKTRMEARGTWNTIFSTDLNSVESLSAAWNQRQRAREDYNINAKDKIKKLKKDTKTLEDHKKTLEATLAKVQDLREKGRGLFQRSFGPAVETLQAHKDSMDETAYNEQLGNIRKQVAAFGKDVGITHMEFFLNEAIGIKPAHARDLKNVYLAPTTGLETSRENAQVSRLWKDLFGKEASEQDISGFLDGMRKEQPEILREFIKTQRLDAHLTTYLRFFFTGKLDGKTLLKESRLAAMTPENVVKFLGMAKEYAKDPVNAERILRDYANLWPDHYTASEFDTIYDQILKTSNRPELTDQLRGDFEPLWQELTGALHLDGRQYEEILQFVARSPNYTEGPQIFVEKLKQLSPERKGLIRFFFDGKFDGTTYIADGGKLMGGLTDEFFQVFNNTGEFFKEKTTKDELKGVLEAFKGTPEFEHDGVKSFTPDVYKRILAEHRKRVSEKKKGKNTTPGAGAAALAN